VTDVGSILDLSGQQFAVLTYFSATEWRPEQGSEEAQALARSLGCTLAETWGMLVVKKRLVYSGGVQSSMPFFRSGVSEVGHRMTFPRSCLFLGNGS
jgi:predicted Rossmann-fold nucleotide-binding protein